MAASQQHTLFDVFPERYDHSIIGLPDIIQGAMAAAAAQGKDVSAAISQVLIGALQQAVGSHMGIPLGLLLPYLTNGQPLTPAQVLQTFRLISPHSIISGFMAKHEYREKSASCPVKEAPWLVSSPFDFEQLNAFIDANLEVLQKPLAIPPLAPVHPELLPGLFVGSPRPWALPEREALQSIVLSEILSRLMFNYSAFPDTPLRQRVNEADEVFQVLINGKTLTRLDDFLAELAARPGASLRGGILKAPATFGTLFTFQHPLHPDAPPLDVPFTLFINTDVVCRETGKGAFIPMTHAGLFLKYASADVSFDVEYYLGSGGNAKFRSGNRRTAKWYQPFVTCNFVSLAETQRAVLAAALYGNLLDHLAVEMRLVNGGYGANGICADSVAPIEKLITGVCTVYPILGFFSNKLILLKRLQQVTAAFEAALAQGDHPVLRQADVDSTVALLKVILTLPADGGINLPDYLPTLNRMKSAIPWTAGQAPFRGADNALSIIENEIRDHSQLF